MGKLINTDFNTEDGIPKTDNVTDALHEAFDGPSEALKDAFGEAAGTALFSAWVEGYVAGINDSTE